MRDADLRLRDIGYGDADDSGVDVRCSRRSGSEPDRVAGGDLLELLRGRSHCRAATRASSVRATMFRNAAAALPTGRIGEASDLAQAYLYLMREGFSTGQVVVVDGGAVLV